MERLGLLAILRNEAPYLPEWLAHYRRQGVTRFFLYDNESTDHPDLSAPDLDVTPWEGRGQQLMVYKDGVERATGEVEWLITVDCDEYMYHPSGVTLAEFVQWRRISPATLVIAPWRIFGWGPHLTKPAGGIVENYFWRARDDHRLHGPETAKSLVRPDRVTGGMVHYFATDGPELVGSGLLTNHYWTKSREEALLKWQRPRADTGEQRSWEEFETTAATEFAEVFDDRLWQQTRRGV